MTTQSKSVLMPFLIIAGIVFAVALAWKFLGSEETETVAKPAQVEVAATAPVKTETKAVKKAPVIVDYDEPTPYLESTEQDREAVRNQARSSMQFAMRYSNYEEALAGLKLYRANGNNQGSSDLIQYIKTTFPNDTIPSNLLD